MKNKFFNFFLLLIGFLFLISYIWLRFIRVRLPKDIPFEMTWFSFFIILYLALIYLFTFIFTIKKIKPNPDRFIFKNFSKLYYYIFLPLITLDQAIKYNKHIFPYYQKILIYFIQKIPPQVTKPYLYLHYIFFIFPRIVLIFTLMLDIYYFKRLFLIYKIIYISILILLGQYILYSLKDAKEQYTVHLESLYKSVRCGNLSWTKIINEYAHYIEGDLDDFDINTACRLNIRQFIEVQTDQILYEGLIVYHSSPTPNKEGYAYFYKYFNKDVDTRFTHDEFEIMKEPYYDIMFNVIIPLSVHIEEYEFKNDTKIIKYPKVIVYGSFFICWSYILIINIIYSFCISYVLI